MILNSIYGIAGSAVTIILNFLVRVVLVRDLGEEINGLHTLFQNVTSVMLLMELGISSAMTIHLYEPIEKRNIQLIKEIMAFYKKIYTYLAFSFWVLSFIIAFTVLDSIVTSSISINKIRVYFLVFSFSFSLNYLTYYKRSILYAEQKNRISICVTAICEMIFRSAQIVLILIFHDYLMFLVLVIFEKISGNMICSYYVNRNHPYLKFLKNIVLAREKKRAIFNTIKPLIVNQTAGTIQQSSTSILISILMKNISIVGYFGNYQLIMMVVQMIYTQFGGSFTTSFGNLAVENDKIRMLSTYKRAAFIMNWMATFFCSIFLVCASDFIYIVFGSHFVLNDICVFILAFYLMILLYDIPMISIQNAMGLHRFDSIQMVFQAILTIILSYVFGLIWGMPGIFIGMSVPLAYFTLFRKGIVIGKVALNIETKDYLIFITRELLKSIITMILCYVICKIIAVESSIISLVSKFIIAVLLSILIPFILSKRSKDFVESKYLINILINKICQRV